MKKVTVAEKVAEKETVAVKVVQIKAKKLTRLELLALSTKEVADLDPSVNYLSRVASKSLTTFLNERGYPKSNSSKKTRIIAMSINNELENKTLKSISLSFRPNSRSHKLLGVLGYTVSNIEKNSKNRVVNGLITKSVIKPSISSRI